MLHMTCAESVLNSDSVVRENQAGLAILAFTGMRSTKRFVKTGVLPLVCSCSVVFREMMNSADARVPLDQMQFRLREIG